ncbi:carboxymuconolactone decarboxylase family protein [Paeniglutamicibacter kerguelensis]|uniref:Alkylhydroperoxidase/carboxymuconolactone decarboxylase family protein YurZ n=1 Tax=Paeniglutamicibacter kerguelensis TaxID=254788 RepID=A0ABS4XBP0_9MICC|nr:carboxymuconolactone decarboxylase family protein [Paeniglutamicibacter kerguelensis]MBP2385691.1 alkylhydroperoxidase/carboxymuconolactone decarboxylase family protein YurZ [Paeniglutamicibacter kerguelensis]
MAEEENPVLDTLVEITTASLDRCSLDPRELMLARIAALAAVDAPPASYLLNARGAMEVGITLQDAQGILVAVAPIIGTPRVVEAASSLAAALGFAIGLEAAAEAQAEAEG